MAPWLDAVSRPTPLSHRADPLHRRLSRLDRRATSSPLGPRGRIRRSRSGATSAAVALLALLTAAPVAALQTSRAPSPVEIASDPALRVTITRTAYGVPHVQAQDLEAGGFGMAWIQMEDYGPRVVRGLLSARGEMGRHFGPDSVGGDFGARRTHRLAVEAFPEIDPAAAAVYRGFARGVNRYVAAHPDDFGADVVPGGVPTFRGADVLARDVVGFGSAGAFERRLEDRGVDAVTVPFEGPGAAEGGGADAPRPRAPKPEVPASLRYRPDPGSNAWALAPSRTTSGHAILLRNPHLSWTAGYYEAHLTVPGIVDFYGDFRVGGPFGIVGGFNRHLGFATTNNGPDLEEVYALASDPGRPDHVRLDGRSVPLTVDTVEVEVRREDGTLETRTRTYRSSPLGPVVAEEDGTVFVVKSAGAGEVRLGVQFLRMMAARSLDAWQEAMRMRARVASNFTYADGDGNIFYVWNATIPQLSHAPTGDTLATRIERTEQAWSRLVPWDSLPSLLNPPGGYVHQENDPFHFTNLNAVFDPETLPPSFPEPDLRLRSQHSLQLIAVDDRLSLEDVVERKHSYRMLLQERVRPDLLRILRESASAAGGDAPGADERARIEAAIDLLAEWDGTVAPGSRGALLFAEWWDRYDDAVDDLDEGGEEGEDPEPFAEPWSFERPTETPRGIGHPDLVRPALLEAMERLEERFGGWNLPWGEVHRARVGPVDLPVGGCHGNLGCFRVLWFEDAEDGLLRVRGGDGWVFAVEFAPVPRAYSINAYGQTDDPTDPHCCDQLPLFVEGRMKPVAYAPPDVDATAVRRYRPVTADALEGAVEGALEGAR